MRGRRARGALALLHTQVHDPARGDAIVTRHRGLLLRTVLVSGLTLVSRLLGFVRETMTAFVFGDGSAISDAFFTAWKVPNLFRRLFGEGALSTSLQAAITEVDGDQGEEAGRALFLRTLSLTAAILVVVSVASMLAVAAMPDRMPLTGWPWLGADPGPVRDLTVRMMPFVLLVCVTALCAGALFVRGHFAVPNAAPAFLNLAWIGALVWVGWRHGWEASARGSREEVLARQWRMSQELAWGVLLGGFVQLVLHVPALAKAGLLGRARAAARGVPRLSRSALSVLWASAPLALGAAVYQVNVMIDGLMAEGLLRDGGPTALYYANRLQQFPLALVATATTTAVFPSLKALGHRGRLAEMRKLHDDAQHAIVFLALPAAVGLWVLARPIASGLFEHGNYGPDGVARITAALRWLAVALLPAGAAGLAGRAFYALGDFKTPVRVSIALLALNVVLNLLFVQGFGMDVEGMTLGTAITTWANTALLWWLLARRADVPAAEPGSARRLFVIALAAAASGAAALAAHELVRGGGRAAALGAGAAAGAGVYLAAARLLGVRELQLVLRRLRR